MDSTPGEREGWFAPMVSRDNAADVLGNCRGKFSAGGGIDGCGGSVGGEEGCDLYRWHVTPTRNYR